MTALKHSVILAYFFLATFANAQAPVQPLPMLSKADRFTLATLRLQGKTQAILLVVVAPGKTASVEQSLRQTGCSIQIKAQEIGYIRCIAPLDKVETISTLSDIQNIALSTHQLGGVYGWPAEPNPNNKDAASNAAAPSRFMSRDNPFTASRSIQTLSFKEAHPSYDGRGTVVSVLEQEIDLLTPELKWAKDLSGASVPKLLDWTLTWDSVGPDALPDGWYYDPKVGLPSLVATEKVEQVDQHLVRFHGKTYRLPDAPSGIEWRMGIFDAQKYVPPLDTNLDGVVNDFDNYTLLLEPQEGVVWVDINHNEDFRDEKPMRDFSIAHDFGVLGKADLVGGARKSRTFIIHIDPRTSDVRMQVEASHHGDMVASVLSATGFMGSEADGIAPGAQIILHENPGGYTHNYAERLLGAFRDARSDVITFSGGDEVRPTDGSYVLDLLTSRMVDVYHKPLFAIAGNLGPYMDSVLSPSTSPRAFSVGGYTPPEAWRANFGIIPTHAKTIVPYSSVGPTDNGALKPDFLGITGTLATAPGFEIPKKLYYQLPAGYAISGGTSAAAPTAAGAAALLISAAKQAGIPYDVERLRTALISTAEFLPGSEARAQGNGVIQIAEAWEALQKLKVIGWKPVEITTDAPVKTATSHRLRIPDRGVGIFETEGWLPGTAAMRDLSFTRRSGSARPITYKLQWKGHTDVFSSDAVVVTLPLNQKVTLPIRISPSKTGSFSAIVSLIDEETGLVVHQTLNTIVVPYLLDATNGYRIEVAVQAPRPGNKTVFVAVPNRTQLLNVQAKVENLADCSLPVLSMTDPVGNSRVRSGGWPNYDNQPFDKEGEAQRSIDDPIAGVWQLHIRNEGDVLSYDDKAHIPLLSCNVRVVATAIRADLHASTTEIHEGKVYSLDFATQFAKFRGRIASLGLGSARTDRPTLQGGGQQVTYELDVPNGTSRLEAVIGDASDLEADMDLYLFDCTGETPLLEAYGVRDSAEEYVSVLDPKPGKWKVVVDPYYLPSGKVQISYRDAFYHEAFGTIAITGKGSAAEPRDINAASVSIDIRARPGTNRTLIAALSVVSDDFYVKVPDPAKESRLTAEGYRRQGSMKVAVPIKTFVFTVP